MSTNTSELRQVAGPSYLIAALLIVIPVVDLISNMVPIRLGDPAWRYGSIGLGSGFLLTPMLGIVLAVLLALLLGHSGLTRVLGWVNLLLGLFLIPLMVLFTLDAIQVRGAVRPESIGQFDIGVIKAVIKLLTGAAAFAWLGLRGVRMKPRSRRTDHSPGLVRSP